MSLTYREFQDLEQLVVEWVASGHRLRDAHHSDAADAYSDCAGALRLVLDRMYLRQVERNSRDQGDEIPC